MGSFGADWGVDPDAGILRDAGGIFPRILEGYWITVDWRGAEATLGFDDFPRSYCCCITIT